MYYKVVTVKYKLRADFSHRTILLKAQNSGLLAVGPNPLCANSILSLDSRILRAKVGFRPAMFGKFLL